MARKILTGIVVVVGVAVAASNPLIGAIIAGGFWVYLVRTVSMRGDTGVDARSTKRIKKLLIIGAICFLVFLVSAVVHNVVSGLAETEEAVFLLLSLSASWAFILSTAGGMVLYLRGRQETA